MVEDRLPLFVDCDPGQDDALALLLAWGSGRFDLKAITTVGGNCSAAQAARNARGLCVLAGHPDTPVYQGLDRDTAFGSMPRSYVHGPTGIEGFDLPGGGDPHPGDAVDAMLSALRTTPGLILCALGPLTNVAEAIRRDRRAFDSVGRVAIMGGGTERGNRTPAAEFNIWVDPEAADVVFSAGLSIELVGLNTTYKALAPESFCETIAAIPNRAGPAVAGLLESYARRYKARLGLQRPAVHDVVVVADLVEPGLVSYVRSNVVVELSGSYTRGATVVDLKGVTDRAPNMNVATDLDTARLWSLIEAALRRLP